MADSVLHCQHADHENKPINYVCINSICTSIRPACFSCLKEFHKEHIDDLLDFEQLHKWAFENFEQFDILDQLIEQLQSVEVILQAFLKQQQSAIYTNLIPSTIDQISKKVDSILCYQQKHQQLCDDVKKISYHLREFVINVNQWSNCDSKLIPQENELKRSQLVKISPERKIHKQKQEPSRYINRVKFQFFQIERNDQINISKLANRVEGIGSCICQPAIPCHGVTIFAYKIIKIDWWTYIGVCMIPNQIKNYQEIGHGSYLISNFGCSYSHHQQDFNDKQNSFQFEKNDVIIIEIDIDNEKISWIKKSTNETFSLQIHQQFEYYPFIELDGIQESVIEIINDF